MLRDWLASATGRRFAPSPAARVAGGNIHHCVRWETEAGPVFVKIASAASLDQLEAEAAGLRELAVAGAVRVPTVLAVGAPGAQAALALEWIAFAAATPRSERSLGERLARLHRSSAERFGWYRDNAIGRTPQRNDWDGDWVRFFVERRLAYQLGLAAQAGLAAPVLERGRRLCEECTAFFSGYRPVPALLHGDLWGGNWAVAASSGEPVLYDPAVYYGDREADLAMTHLFGGFGPAFYAAYEAAWPLDAAAGSRRTLYNLYHVLNHWNLFGGGYGAQAAAMIERLLAEL